MTDPLLARYGAIARRVHALLETGALAPPQAAAVGLPAPQTAEAERLLDDACYRLGLYVSAMPGAKLPALPAHLAALDSEARALGLPPLEHEDLAAGDPPADG